MPLEHLVLPITSLASATNFYLTILAPLSYKIYLKLDRIVGFEVPGHNTDFWIAPVAEGEKISKIHLAFKADGKAAVDEFHAAALKAGATCNGPPGYRTQYSPEYYAAYIIDPDGHNIEAVHWPGSQKSS